MHFFLAFNTYKIEKNMTEMEKVFLSGLYTRLIRCFSTKTQPCEDRSMSAFDGGLQTQMGLPDKDRQGKGKRKQQVQTAGHLFNCL